jgi:hypothetical protein
MGHHNAGDSYLQVCIRETMRLTRSILALAAIAISSLAFGQAAYVLPTPTGADEVMTLYIDIAQTTEGVLKAYLELNPGADVYLWAWQPTEPVHGNGEWTDSNEEAKLTHESGMLYSMTFIPTEFFGVDGPTFYNNGISCLAKLDDGSFIEDLGGEPKCEDLIINIIPKLCDSKYCVFPQVAEPHDYITISYNQDQETVGGLIDADPNEIYCYLTAKTGFFDFNPYVEADMVTSTPELKMKEVVGMPGNFRLTIIPEEFWADIIDPELKITEVQYYILIPGFTYTGQPPSQLMPMLDCE